MDNYGDVLSQLQAAGLVVERLEVDTAKPVRCRVEGDREKRGWYRLYELVTSRGERLVVGSYGVWRGTDPGATKVELDKERSAGLSEQEREALRLRLAEDRRRADAERKAAAERAARAAAAAWKHYAPEGDAEYLRRKGVQGYGLRYTEGGAAVVPLLDVSGKIHGLQFLRTPAQARLVKRPAKEFWPSGVAKKGHFHLVGIPDWIVLIAEGYATAATLHAATGYPVAVAFDCGNLLPVAEALHARYRRARILICADDDFSTTGNPGVSAASAAALAVGGAYVQPVWADDAARREQHAAGGAKLTDFNDLARTEGMHVVAQQVSSRLSALGWQRRAEPPRLLSHGGGRGEALRPISDVDELLERFALVYAHGGAVFDRREHLLMALSDMRDACVRRDIHRFWAEHPGRQVVRVEEVGFDPTQEDPAITCNLFAGWPTTPKRGDCRHLLDLLRYMCSGEKNAVGLYDWVLRWLAYPIQRPGAKMRTTLVVHGPQGTGKNLFFECVMRIYGPYGDVIDQSAVEDRFNDWVSRKLFLLADEVVARSDLYHVKNKLKALITGDRVRINPKNLPARWEANHLNLVFLSNEAMPVVLEEDDRRHCVIWTPQKADGAFYSAVKAEIEAGGIAALHQHLLGLDLRDFGEATLPPETEAKAELIDLAHDSPMRFWEDLQLGEIRSLHARPGLATDWYEAYKVYCVRHGLRPAPMPRFVNQLERRRSVRSARKRYEIGAVEHGPHGVLFLGNARHPNECPPDRREREWLGEQVSTLRSELAEYRGST